MPSTGRDRPTRSTCRGRSSSASAASRWRRTSRRCCGSSCRARWSSSATARRALGLERRYPHAHFLGALHGEALARVYASADVFVFPSRTDTFGIVLVEAMASGLPVAAYPVAGPLDVIGDSGAGALDDDLGAACLAALEIPREKAREHSLRFTWRESARQFLAAHRGLPQSRADRPAGLTTTLNDRSRRPPRAAPSSGAAPAFWRWRPFPQSGPDARPVERSQRPGARSRSSPRRRNRRRSCRKRFISPDDANIVPVKTRASRAEGETRHGPGIRHSVGRSRQAAMGGGGRSRRRILRGGRLDSRRAGQRRLARGRGGLHLLHRLSFLRPVHHQMGARRRSGSTDAGFPSQRRPRLRSDQPLRALRPSFRGDRRRGPAGGASAGRPDGLSAGNVVDSRGRGFRRRRAGHDRALPFHEAGWKVARRDGALRDGAGRRRGRRHRRASHHASSFWPCSPSSWSRR